MSAIETSGMTLDSQAVIVTPTRLENDQPAELRGHEVTVLSEDEISLNSVLRTVISVSLTVLIISGVLYTAGCGLTATGSLLAGRSFFAISLNTPALGLIAIGNAVASAGTFLCKVITTPIYLVGYKLPNWILETALPTLKHHAERLVDSVIAIAAPCFAGICARLGVVGDVLGKITHWFVHQVIANGFKIIDKTITSIWKGVATSFLYAVSKVAPGGSFISGLAGRACVLAAGAKSYLFSKLVSLYHVAANSFLKPVVDGITRFVQKYFGSVSRRAIESCPSSSLMSVSLAATPRHVQEMYAAQQEIVALAQLAIA